MARTFAFGSDHVECTDCPAFAAGFEPKVGDGSTVVAEAFDERVREYLWEMMGNPSSRADVPSEGTIPEWLARDLWLDMLEYYRSTEFQYPLQETASELGWN